MLISPTKILRDPFAPQTGQVFVPIRLPETSQVALKIEGLGKDGSIKAKPAREMIADAIRRGVIDPRYGVIETSSGNTARALARICSQLGYPCTIIVDPNVSATNVATVEAFGARVLRVETSDPGGGYQASRIARLKAECAAKPQLYWPNQYDNPANAIAHMKTTGPEILTAHPDVARVYCAVGTGGTATGLGRFFNAAGTNTQVIACDVVGSVTFGGKVGPRYISGPGNSFVPGNWDAHAAAATVSVPEAEAVAVCRWLAQTQGLLVGGSTGVTIAGAIRDIAMRPLPQNAGSIVVISPDTGEKYLPTIWNNIWVEERYGAEAVRTAAIRLGIA